MDRYTNNAVHGSFFHVYLCCKQSVYSLGSIPSRPTKQPTQDRMKITLQETQTTQLRTRPAKTVSIEIQTDEPEPKPNTEPASGRVRRLVVRKFILSLCVLWMIPWYLVTQVLRAILCVTVGAQNLWWHPIREAKDSWDSNA